MNITLNIGLNRNKAYTANHEPITERDLLESMGVMDGDLFTDFKMRIEQGEWNGEVENTAVISFTSTQSKRELLSWVRFWCVSYGQECIAIEVRTNSGNLSLGDLVYHPLHKGERLEFNSKYFIQY